jgi:hypothetical protein
MVFNFKALSLKPEKLGWLSSSGAMLLNLVVAY